jgi:hypothetical protein
MNIITSKSLTASLAAALCCLAFPASAQTLTITPSNATVTAGVASFTVTKGSTFTFLVSLTSTGGTLSLNSDNADFFTGPGATELNPPTSSGTLALDDSIFFNTLPKTLPGTQSNVSLFTVTAGTSAVTGTYTGDFTVQGAPSPDTATTNDLATVNFSINVAPAPTPEPSSLIVEGLGLLGLSALIIKRRQVVSE